MLWETCREDWPSTHHGHPCTQLKCTWRAWPLNWSMLTQWTCCYPMRSATSWSIGIKMQVLCLMLWRVLPPQPEQDFYLSAGNLVKMQAALCHWAFGSMEYLWNGIDLKASSSLHSISLASSMLILRHLGSHWLWSTKNFLWRKQWKIYLGSFPGALPAYMLVFFQQVQCLDKSHSILGDRSKLVSLWMQVVCS